MNKKYKMILLFLLVAAVIIVLMVSIALFLRSPMQRLKKQITLGQKYLSELDFEAAAAAFTTGFEIDPNNTSIIDGLTNTYTEWSLALSEAGEFDSAIERLDEALALLDGNELLTDLEVSLYLDWSDMYLQQGDEDNALAILRMGQLKLGDERISKRISEIEDRQQEEIVEEVEEPMVPIDAIRGSNDHYYYIYPAYGSWEEAKEYCESLGGHLASITSREEDEEVFRYMNEMGYESAYFGLSDEVSEGDWQWVNGEESDYMNWADGEPNGQYGVEFYAMYYYVYDEGGWNDGSFQEANKFIICEWD